MTEPRLPESESTLPDGMVAERRRLILQALGKGGAAMAALSPLASHAARTHKIANSTLSGGFGFCSVSGFQSAAISGAPAAICSTYSPSRFLITPPETLTYTNLVSGTPNGNKLATALNNKYFGGANLITDAQAGSLLSGTKLVVSPTASVPSPNLVILPNGSSSGTALRLKNSSSPSPTDGGTLFKSIFTTSASTQTLAETLYEGYTSSTPGNGRCYILAAYLSVSNNAGTLPAGFDKAYILSTYTSDADLLKNTKTYNFYRALAVTA